jgi:hypothetical protein
MAKFRRANRHIFSSSCNFRQAKLGTCHSNTPDKPSDGGLGEARPLPSEFFRSFTIDHVNVQGFESHAAELEGHIALNGAPHLLALNETFLDRSRESVQIGGFELISRRDRGSFGGGIALFALRSVAASVTLLEKAVEHERCWHVIHSDIGPILLCVWYRPPSRGEVASIEGFKEEWSRLSSAYLGTIVVGDLNIHHIHWLKHSTGVTVEGTAMYRFCCDNGFTQLVRQPTRDKNLLDLAITDMGEVESARVLPRIADHNVVRTIASLGVPQSASISREVYLYKSADWKGLCQAFSNADWRLLDSLSVDEGCVAMTEAILHAVDRYVPKKTLTERNSSHPWLNARCMDLISEKRAAEGTAHYRQACQKCSEGIFEEFTRYTQRMRQKLRKTRRGSKHWWRIAKSLANKAQRSVGIPALKNMDGAWVLDPEHKANLLAETFQSKFGLPVLHENAYSHIGPPQERNGRISIRARDVECVLRSLNIDSSTGPDSVAALVLKRCAPQIAIPLAKLIRRIIRCHRWPALWVMHWIVALHKRLSIFSPKNYRGVHLTSQLSKVAERVLIKWFGPQLERHAFGQNQFAYRKRHGARDAVAFYVLSWIYALCCGCKVGVYCSDVSGAFDKVSSERLVQKLAHHGVHTDLLAVIKSWLRTRHAYVVIAGARSDRFDLANMVFQGTVWGPTLWNTYFGDAACVLQGYGYTIVIYADDYNAFKSFPSSTSNAHILQEIQSFQLELHTWGQGNQVIFDAGKESFMIISTTEPEGGPIRLLGIDFDAKLQMHTAIGECVREASWRLRTLLRTRRFHTDAELLMLFKAHVLSFLEYRTPAIFHASETALEPLNRVLFSFLRDICMTAQEAILHFNMLPLSSRRDIAMLGVLHRAVLRQGPQQFWQWTIPDLSTYRRSARFQRNTLRPLTEVPNTNHLRIGRQSLFGMIRVYNLLPNKVVAAETVSDFQRRLTELMKQTARQDIPMWPHIYSCRTDMAQHILRTLCVG